MHSLGLFTLGLSISFHLCEIKTQDVDPCGSSWLEYWRRMVDRSFACYSLAFHLSFRSPLLKTAIWFLAEFGSSSSNWCLVHQPRAFHPLARVCGWLKWWTRRNLAHISPCLPWSYSDWDLIKKLPMSMRPCSSCAMQMQDEACFALESLTGREMLCRSPDGCFALHQILRDPSKSQDWAL